MSLAASEVMGVGLAADMVGFIDVNITSGVLESSVCGDLCGGTYKRVVGGHYKGVV